MLLTEQKRSSTDTWFFVWDSCAISTRFNAKSYFWIFGVHHFIYLADFIRESVIISSEDHKVVISLTSD